MSAYQELPEKELSVLLKGDSKEAFAEIYRRYWQKMYVVARNRLNNEYEAEEVVQDIFLNLWKKRSTFNLTTAFNNYFAVAVKFEVLTIMRKRANVKAYQHSISYSFNESDLSTLRQLDLMELQEKLRITVNKLPEKCQLVFRLRHEEGMSQKDIAAKLQLSEKTIEAHLTKARVILKREFGDLLSLILIIFFN